MLFKNFEISLSNNNATVIYNLAGSYLDFGISSNYGLYRLHLTLDDSWTDLNIRATFSGDHMEPVSMIMDSDNLIQVPPEATATVVSESNPGCIVFVGVDSEGIQRRVSTSLHYIVNKTCITDGINTGGSAPTVLDQLQQIGQLIVNEASLYSDSSEQSANNAQLFASNAQQSAVNAAQSAILAQLAAQLTIEESELAIINIESKKQESISEINLVKLGSITEIQQETSSLIGNIQNESADLILAIQTEGEDQVKVVEEAASARVDFIEELANKAETSAQNALESEISAAESALSAYEYLEQVKTVTLGALGFFPTPEALRAAVPIGEAGWWAIVGSTDTIWIWDTDTNKWLDSSTRIDLADYYTKENIDAMLLHYYSKDDGLKNEDIVGIHIGADSEGNPIIFEVT